MNEEIGEYIIKNDHNLTISILELGGIITSIKIPKNNEIIDIVLGFDNYDNYFGKHPYFGAIIGRYANRIGNGTFCLEGKKYELKRNNGKNHLHGGIKGFDKVIWESETIIKKNEAQIILKYLSKDGEEGYPGNLQVYVTYTLTNNNELRISYKGETDKPTVVNLTNHSYFNLNGEGEADILGHFLTINGDYYTVVDENLIPTGEIKKIEGTALDFRKREKIGRRIKEAGGYDHNYVLNKTREELSLGAIAEGDKSGIIMEVYTTEPGLQFYTGNFLDGTLKGKKGNFYNKHYGFCLETQHFPDSPNKPEFPGVILLPGEVYTEETVYKFKWN